MSLQYEYLQMKAGLHAGLRYRSEGADKTALWTLALVVTVLVFACIAVLIIPFDADVSRYAVATQWEPVNLLRSLTNVVLAAPYILLFSTIIAVCLILRWRMRKQQGFELKIPSMVQTYHRFATLAGQSIFAIAAILSAGLIVNILKYIVGRPRPFLIDTAGPFGFKPFDFSHAYVSFPSGHACTAAVLATLLALWFPRYRIFAYAGLALIASSRVFVQAHYLSDVVTGFAIGAVTTLILARFLAQSCLLFRFEEGRLFPLPKFKNKSGY